jgi:hypothetical protein
MATNRLYLVDAVTKEYVCLAKALNGEWLKGNNKINSEFLATRNLESKLVVGSENDEEFYNEHLANGKNYNEDNAWVYD